MADIGGDLVERNSYSHFTPQCGYSGEHAAANDKPGAREQLKLLVGGYSGC
jgi:hypothetical protein